MVMKTEACELPEEVREGLRKIARERQRAELRRMEKQTQCLAWIVVVLSLLLCACVGGLWAVT